MSNAQLNFYDILNASSPNATIDELKSNYKQLILQCHPDKLLQQQQQKEIKVKTNKLENNDDDFDDDPNNSKFVVITEAWNCLKDPLKRKQYDAELLLNKFQTHNNIYAHIKLNEMKKQPYTDEYAGEDAEVVEEEVEEVAKGMKNLKADEDDEEEVCNTPKYLYTYECRCGGQYIVDESAEQYCCRTANNHGSKVKIKNNESNEVDNSLNGVDGDDDDDADKNITQNKNSPHNPNECKNSGGAGGVTAAAPTAGNGSEGVVLNEDNEEGGGGELIVECSECSLVIMLNG